MPWCGTTPRSIHLSEKRPGWRVPSTVSIWRISLRPEDSYDGWKPCSGELLWRRPARRLAADGSALRHDPPRGPPKDQLKINSAMSPADPPRGARTAQRAYRNRNIAATPRHSARRFPLTCCAARPAWPAAATLPWCAAGLLVTRLPQEPCRFPRGSGSRSNTS